jgi:pimeloyl-ACP methyl ester carboxylesterase
MQPEEVSALGEVAGGAVAGLAGHIHDVHGGIAERVFGAVGPAATPVRTAHDRVSEGVYRTVGRSLERAARAGARALSRRTPAEAPSLERSVAARFAVGVLNGAFGDKLESRSNALAWQMTVRCQDDDVPLTPQALAAAYPAATGRLALFLHGLCETEEAWRWAAARHLPYGERLRTQLGYTPIYVRYNTGRHISQNGRELGRLLTYLTAGWPVEIQEIALFGHSMGGLVCRSACHYGAASDWTDKVRHVFTLGSPHRGAPLELAAYAACSALGALPETRAYAKALNHRSAGIKDLGRGYLVDEDWREHDPEAFLTRTGQEIPFLPTANHYFVAATLTRDADAPLGRMMGDLLVLRASAWAHEGRGHRMRFPVEHYSHVGGASHFDLLNHPAVYGQIARWLAGRPALPAPAAA